uniref:Synaptopodin 2b n=1 Tax=Electrophorus electricus TaxID=8005 RepID=A0A4W4EAP9_ELEEL
MYVFIYLFVCLFFFNLICFPQNVHLLDILIQSIFHTFISIYHTLCVPWKFNPLPYGCLRCSEGQSEKHLKEVQSKCKCIALLLTAAPNPESKGVLIFRKRRQRARKFMLVSYGTGKPIDNSFKDEYRFDRDSLDQNFRFSSATTSGSELEEDSSCEAESRGTALNITYNFNPLAGGVSINHSWKAMEQLPQTKGKGVLMFAKRRQRIDEIAAEHEEMRRKGIPVEAFAEDEVIVPSMPVTQKETALVKQDVQVKQQLQYQEQQYQLQHDYHPNTGVNGLDPSSMSKSLVPNRTAKPFLGGLNQAPKQFSSVKGVPSPTLKKPENIFKVPIPVNTSPQVWSPTGDIIASRDERIVVPAIKTGILPEIKRRGTNKSDSREFQEEDHLSLGAEACNFMQVPTVRQKNPPPVLPKPAINPACPPWSTEGHTPRSPLTPSSPAPVQVYSTLAQKNQALHKPQPQPCNKSWVPSPTQRVPQQHMSGWLPPSQSTSNQATWPSEPQQAPMSIQSPTVCHAAPPQSKVPWAKPQYQANSVASCPPHRGSSYFHPSNTPSASSRGHASETGFSDRPTFKGKGAELFARRQTRMEKFVVDTETVQANKARPPSPTLSMPSAWKYSPNIRAPPPVSYNPIVSPFYPLAAQKQSPNATSPKSKSETSKEQPKPKAKHLSVVDVMKHQPYQLNSSLFTYNFSPEMKPASPKASPVPPPKKLPAPPAVHDGHSTKVFSSLSTPLITTATNVYVSPSSFLHNSKVISRHALPMAPRPRFSAKKAAVGGNRSHSMSLPRGHSSVSSPSFHSTRGTLNRQMSGVERLQKPFSPWEATVQSPLGLVDEVFGTAHRKSLPESSLDWKRQVSNNPTGRPIAEIAVGIPSFSKAFSPASGKTIPYGPPFRPAQPLPGDRYTGTSSLPRNFSPHSNMQMYRVSWKQK